MKIEKSYDNSMLKFWHTLLFLGAVSIFILSIILFDVPENMHRPIVALIANILWNALLMFLLFKAYFVFIKNIFNRGDIVLAYIDTVGVTLLYLFLSFVGCNLALSVH